LCGGDARPVSLRFIAHRCSKYEYRRRRPPHANTKSAWRWPSKTGSWGSWVFVGRLRSQAKKPPIKKGRADSVTHILLQRRGDNQHRISASVCRPDWLNNRNLSIRWTSNSPLRDAGNQHAKRRTTTGRRKRWSAAGAGRPKGSKSQVPCAIALNAKARGPGSHESLEGHEGRSKCTLSPVHAEERSRVVTLTGNQC
jgi:hypothetical protein